jgi:hypothetical protein
MRFEHLLSPEELTELLDSLDSGLDHRPLPAVLDTACVRTGLHYQLRNGSPPASVTTARDGEVRLFMEYDTLTETGKKLPKFARDLGVTVAELRRILNEEWLPNIQIVKLPPSLRQLDPRALSVRDSDADDYPAAALAALLSPCILLTHNHNDFAALGVHTTSQGIDAVMAVIAINIGEMQVHAVLVVPALPIRLAAAGVKWATERIGPAAWVILILAAAGGIYWYRKQPPERRERIKEIAGDIGTHFMNEYAGATEVIQQARLKLRANIVPKPEQRTTASAILRELAVAPESLSAQQLADKIDASLRPKVADLRAYLRGNEALFAQARRGGFELGRHYRLPDAH